MQKKTVLKTRQARLKPLVKKKSPSQKQKRIAKTDLPSLISRLHEKNQKLEKTIVNYDHNIQCLERALDASSLVSVTNAQGIITYANAKFCEVSEYSHDELLGQNHRIINSGYHSKEFMTNLWQTISKGHVWKGDIRNRKKSGGYYWVQSTIIPFLNELGKPYQYYSIRYDISERKLFEEQLLRSQEALLQARRLAHLGSWEWNPEEDKPVWSTEMYQIFGLDPASPAVNFSKIHEFYTPESWQVLNSAVKKTYVTGEPYQLECEILRKDKSHGWVIASGIAARDEAGKITGLHGTLQDITERKQKDERDRLIVNALPDLIFILDHSGTFLDYHASDVKRLAFPPEQFLGKSFQEIFPLDVAIRMEQCIHAVSNEGLAKTIEYALEIQRETKYFEASFSTLDAKRIMVIARDITERRQADEKVHEQAMLLDKAGDAIIVKSIDHKIQYWNKGAEKIYGWTSEEVAGRSTRDLIYDKFEDFNAAITQVLQEGEFKGELNQITKDRQKITVQARWTLLCDNHGKAKSVLCISTDITERRKLEQQFLRAQRLESIGTLAGGIAHDLNNALTPVLLALEMLKISDISADQLALLSTAELSARRGADMVKQVLSFARGAEGNPALMKIDKLILDLEKIIRDTFPKNIALTVKLPATLWPIRGDATQLHQVFLNMGVNARDAMPDGGELLMAAENSTLDAQYAGMNSEVKPGNYIRIKIEDTGTGMPAEVAEKIFEPFFTTKELGKGTGLGLSTSIAIIKAHGGFIRVYSEPGRGTKFHIYLPAFLTGEINEEHPSMPILPRGDGELILVVDDEAPIRDITKQTLEAFGYTVKTAADGAEAVAIFAEMKGQIALVLTDMMMPILDGMGTIQVIHKMNPKVPIIAASGLDTNGKMARLTNEGVQFFLAKPYTADILLKTIKQALVKDPKK